MGLLAILAGSNLVVIVVGGDGFVLEAIMLRVVSLGGYGKGFRCHNVIQRVNGAPLYPKTMLVKIFWVQKR
jgi:hypothetical protein